MISDGMHPQRSVIYMLWNAISWLEVRNHTFRSRKTLVQMSLFLDDIFRTRLSCPGVNPAIVQGLFNLFPHNHYLWLKEVSLFKDINRAKAYHGFGGFESFMTDPARSGSIFVPEIVCHARLAVGCMHLLGHPRVLHSHGLGLVASTAYHTFGDWQAQEWYDFFTMKSVGVDATLTIRPRLEYARRHWAKHLSLSSTGSTSHIVFCLSVFGSRLVNRLPSCRPSASMIRPPTKATHAENHCALCAFAIELDIEPISHQDDHANAKVVVEWLKKVDNPQAHGLIHLWTPCRLCGAFHTAEHYRANPIDEPALPVKAVPALGSGLVLDPNRALRRIMRIGVRKARAKIAGVLYA
ncbi:hypothetical protein FPV67DRAFT_789240 [Lyophyllum atratum]|nr:hypothetical protein FPV67DRAFT_789240 [Lyophyllum atratum]